jgi:thiol-disulfide isomerase/thioredoxin
MMVFAARVFFFFLFAAFLFGCRSGSERGGKPGLAVQDSVSLSHIEVAKLDAQGLSRLMRERNGKILFLNIWATWCAPCVEEFPDLIKLHRAFGGRPVDVVGISADFDDEVESKIIPFLKKQGVPFRVYVASFRRQQDFINAIDRSWSGALPASLIIDPQGKRSFFLVGKGTFEQFKKEIEKTMGGL